MKTRGTEMRSKHEEICWKNASRSDFSFADGMRASPAAASWRYFCLRRSELPKSRKEQADESAPDQDGALGWAPLLVLINNRKLSLLKIQNSTCHQKDNLFVAKHFQKYKRRRSARRKRRTHFSCRRPWIMFEKLQLRTKEERLVTLDFRLSATASICAQFLHK